MKFYCVFFRIFHVLQLLGLISFVDVCRLNLDEIIVGEADVVDCGQHDFDHYNNYHCFPH